MGKGFGVALVCAVLGCGVCAAPAAADDRATMDRYARDTWASFVAMTDRAVRAAGRQPVLRRDDAACRRRRRTSAPTCGAPSPPSGSGSSATHEAVARARRRRSTTLETMERHERERPVLQLVRPPQRRQAHGLAADRRAAHADPLVGRQRLARDRAADRRRAACPSSRTARGRSTTAMDFGFYYRPAVNRIAVPLRARHRRRARAATTRSSARAGSRLHRDRQGRAAGEGVLRRAGARSPTPATGAGRRRSPSGVTRTYDGVTVFEGAYPYAGMRVVAGWGGSMFEALMPALFVPEERWAPRSWGDQPPARRSPRRSTTGSRRRATATGASRPPTPRRAAMPPTASTRSAWTRTATRRTRTTRSSTTASRAAPAATRSPTRRRPRTRTAS